MIHEKLQPNFELREADISDALDVLEMVREIGRKKAEFSRTMPIISRSRDFAFGCNHVSTSSDGNRIERYIVINLKEATLTEWIDEAKYYYLDEIKDFLKTSGFKVCGQFENIERKTASDPVEVHYLYCQKVF